MTRWPAGVCGSVSAAGSVPGVLAARSRPKTVLATGHDLKVFFALVAKDPAEVTTADVLVFITVQRGDRRVVRLADGESDLSAHTIQRRLSSMSGLFGFLAACGELDTNPVPRGLSNRKRSRTDRGTPLVRSQRRRWARGGPGGAGRRSH